MFCFFATVKVNKAAGISFFLTPKSLYWDFAGHNKGAVLFDLISIWLYNNSSWHQCQHMNKANDIQYRYCICCIIKQSLLSHCQQTAFWYCIYLAHQHLAVNEWIECNQVKLQLIFMHLQGLGCILKKEPTLPGISPFEFWSEYLIFEVLIVTWCPSPIVWGWVGQPPSTWVGLLAEPGGIVFQQLIAFSIQ